MHAGKEKKHEQVPKLVNMGEKTINNLHLSCHFKFNPSVESRSRSLCLFGIHLLSMKFFVDSRNY